MKVIVTGGAGFVGSALCQLLLDAEKEVACIDNLVTGSRNNIKTMIGNSRFDFINQDITKPFRISGKVGIIFNLASPASPVDYQNIPIETLLVNSAGTKNMLDLAVEKKAVFVQASTSEIYGNPAVHPQREDYWGNVNPIGPRSCYDEGKRFAEALCMAYWRKKEADVRIARIFNTYGPKMRPSDGRVVPNFIIQALDNKPMTIYGDGTQTRSFCYVDDLVEGLLRLGFKKGLAGEVVNLGNPNEFTIRDFAEKVKKLSGARSKIVFKPLPADDPLKRKPNISKAKKLLQWEPKVGLEEGLQQTIAYFKTIV